MRSKSVWINGTERGIERNRYKVYEVCLDDADIKWLNEIHNKVVLHDAEVKRLREATEEARRINRRKDFDYNYDKFMKKYFPEKYKMLQIEHERWKKENKEAYKIEQKRFKDVDRLADEFNKRKR